MDMEQEIKDAGADKAPRVTPADIETAILNEFYFTASDGVLGAMGDNQHLDTPLALSLLTICVLVLSNDFTVIGTSACASPANFNAEIGRKIARQDAVRQVWPLLGFRLRDRLVMSKILGFDPRTRSLGDPTKFA